jgi:hypothetical protein
VDDALTPLARTGNLWGVHQLIGKLTSRVYVLSR